MFYNFYNPSIHKKAVLIYWMTNIRVKHYREKELNNCISLSQWPCADSLLGLWKSTNSNGNMNTTEHNLQAVEKVYWKRGEVVICTMILKILQYVWTLLSLVKKLEKFNDLMNFIITWARCHPYTIISN